MSAKSENAMQELEKLVGAPTKFQRVVTWFTIETGEDGEEYPKAHTKKLTMWIREVQTGDIPAAVRAAGRMIPMLSDKSLKIDPITLMALHPDECLNLISVLTKTPREDIDRLDLDDSTLLLQALLEANLGFFVRKVLPLLSGGLAKLVEQAQSLAASLGGRTQSPT